MKPLELLYNDAKNAPPESIAWTLDFLRYLKERNPGKDYEALSLSFAVLSEDWFIREEDEAWEDLPVGSVVTLKGP